MLETEFLQDCAVFSVSRTLAQSPRTGESHSFYRIDSADWVNIVPVTPEGQLVLVEQYRRRYNTEHLHSRQQYRTPAEVRAANGTPGDRALLPEDRQPVPV